jgi:porin
MMFVFRNIKGIQILTFLLLFIQRAEAQDEATAPPPHVSERLAEPYTIDLLPESLEEITFDEVPSSETSLPESTVSQTQWGPKTLTGDLFNKLFSTRESGFSFGGRVTQFGFGIAGGIDRPVPSPLGQGNTFKYTGRSEYDLLLDLEKLGGPAKGRFLVRAEQWYGEYGSVSLRAGTFTPPVFPALLPPRPNDPGVPYITNMLWTQPLSPNWIVFAGKKDVLGSLDQDIFAGGDGTDQFVNQALIANPAFLLGMPYTSFTAGFVSTRKWGGFGGFVYDPRNRTADFMQVSDLFASGIIVGGEIKLRTNFFDLPGQQHIGAIWKHDQQTDLRFAFEVPAGSYNTPNGKSPTLWNSYTIYYGLDQYLFRFSQKPDRGWGLFSRAAITDGNPNPIHYFLSAGLGGFSPLGQRRGDTFGIGWFLAGASSQFGPVPTALFDPKNGSGVELFYNYQATPWLNITPDVQWLRPGMTSLATDNACVYGLRINMTF